MRPGQSFFASGTRSGRACGCRRRSGYRELVGTFIKNRLTTENRYFGRLDVDGWQGSFFKHDKYPRRWSAASQLEITANDWQHALPPLLAQLDSDSLQVIKRSRSGDVLATTVTLGGRELRSL